MFYALEFDRSMYWEKKPARGGREEGGGMMNIPLKPSGSIVCIYSGPEEYSG